MSTPDKTQGSDDVPETEFGEKEKSRLVEVLGDECKRTCLTCEGVSEIYISTKPVRCRSCDGRGFHSTVPSGLAIIEECRKRGVQISVDSFMDGYEVECFQRGRFVMRSECEYADLESAISLAALKGLEAVANSEFANNFGKT